MSNEEPEVEVSEANVVVPPPQTALEPPPHVSAYPHPQAHQPVDANSDPLRFVIPVNPSGWAVAAGYAGIFAVLLPLAPIAIILGLVALKDLKKNPSKTGLGRAIFGIVAGTVCTLFFIYILITVLNQKPPSGS